MPEKKRMPSFLETLSQDRTTLKKRLETAANLDTVPTEGQLDALLQSMDVFTHLQLLPEPDNYLTLFRWQNLPGYLERLHVETQVLRQECSNSSMPTRSLLEQQLSLKHTGMIVLDHLDELLESLQHKREDNEKEGIMDTST